MQAGCLLGFGKLKWIIIFKWMVTTLLNALARLCWTCCNPAKFCERRTYNNIICNWRVPLQFAWQESRTDLSEFMIEACPTCLGYVFFLGNLGYCQGFWLTQIGFVSWPRIGHGKIFRICSLEVLTQWEELCFSRIKPQLGPCHLGRHNWWEKFKFGYHRHKNRGLNRNWRF